jgi:hypothetical protein
LPYDLPYLCVPGDALERVGAAIFVVESAPSKRFGALADHHFTRLGHRLHALREIRRFAYRRFLRRQDVRYDHRTRGYPDTNPQRSVLADVELRQSVDNR